MKREYGMHEGGLGIGDWANPQSPSPIPMNKKLKLR